MAYVTLSSKAIGSTIKLKVNGSAKDFIVVHQGKPSSIYDDSCDGTWVLLKDIYVTDSFSNNGYNSYKDSNIHSYLNNTFYDLIDSDIRAAIKQVKIPYWNGKGNSGSLATGANGLSTKVFLLSSYEVGKLKGYYIPQDGAELDYFESDSTRIAYYSGSAERWWLRSPVTSGDSNPWVVDSDGSVESYSNGNRFVPLLYCPLLSWCLTMARSRPTPRPRLRGASPFLRPSWAARTSRSRGQKALMQRAISPVTR